VTEETSGLIGSTTIDQLLNEKPAEIVIFDNMSRGTTRNLEKCAQGRAREAHQGDIRDKDAVYKVTEGMDAVIHMAAIRITACAADPREAVEVNDGTFSVIDAAHKASAKALAASSASILGSLMRSRPRKTTTLRRTWYGASRDLLRRPAAVLQHCVACN
jgi:UDP-glucose 4-epimerase